MAPLQQYLAVHLHLVPTGDDIDPAIVNEVVDEISSLFGPATRWSASLHKAEQRREAAAGRFWENYQVCRS